MEAYQKQIVLNAFVLLLIGLLAGVLLIFSLIGGVEILPNIFIPIQAFGTTEGWVRAHSGGIMNGLMLIAFAYILPHCGLEIKRIQFYAKGIIFAGWANTIFYWAGNFSNNRALSFTGNRLGLSNVMGWFGYTVASIAALVTIYIVVQMIRGFISKP